MFYYLIETSLSFGDAQAKGWALLTHKEYVSFLHEVCAAFEYAEKHFPEDPSMFIEIAGQRFNYPDAETYLNTFQVNKIPENEAKAVMNVFQQTRFGIMQDILEEWKPL